MCFSWWSGGPSAFRKESGQLLLGVTKVQSVMPQVGKLTRPMLTFPSASLSVLLFWCSKQQKNMEGNCLEIHQDWSALPSFPAFATVATVGPTGHLTSYCAYHLWGKWQWMTHRDVIFFAKFLWESRREANIFSWGGNLNEDPNQKASPPLGLYM